MEVTPVISIDKYEIGYGQITEKIHKTYLDVAIGKINEYKNWLIGIY